MIVVDRGKLKFLLAGRSVDVDVSREYRKGRSYALGLSHKHSVCRVRVSDTVELEAGWRLTVVRDVQDAPRLLARNPGAQRRDYVDKLADAVFEEPEALGAEELRSLTQYRAARAHSERVTPRLVLRDRIMADLDEALRTSVSRDEREKLRAARHHLRRIA